MPSECSTAHLHRPPPTLPALLLLRFCVGHLSGRGADRWLDLEVGDDEKEVDEEKEVDDEYNEEYNEGESRLPCCWISESRLSRCWLARSPSRA